MRLHVPFSPTIPSRRQVERALKKMAQAQGMMSQVDLDHMQVIGRGVHRVAFQVSVQVRPDPASLSGEHVLLYPYPEEAEGIYHRLQREAEALTLLNELKPIFRLPKLLAHTEAEGSVILFERFVDGVPLDLRVGRCLVGEPWEVAGEIAARVHDYHSVAERLEGGFKTRREHALHDLELLGQLEEGTFHEALAWCKDHLPPEGAPTTLLHGDLSGQNILVHPQGLLAPALIDWTFVLRGDPAHELAIITQGKRRPFEVDHGRERLLEAYKDAGGAEITLEEIYLYEFCLFARRYRAAKTKGVARLESPQEPLRMAYNLLKRLTGRPW